MADRFRELERPQSGRLKDIVLMATVSSFESLRFPSRSVLQQFSELFEPLYRASSEDARRQAVAALSRSPHVPERTARFIGLQPIDIAAIFLTGARGLADATLLHLLEVAGPDHARAIAGRDALSPAVVQALVDRHQNEESRRTGAERALAAQEAERAAREEAVRDELRALMLAAQPAKPMAPLPLEPATETHQALFVRFARVGETGMLAVTLADALASSQWLSERILLDLSGRQLAETLLALAVPAEDCHFVLEKLYPHLVAEGAAALLDTLDTAKAVERVESWRRADSYTNGGDLPEAANNGHETPGSAAAQRAAG